MKLIVRTNKLRLIIPAPRFLLKTRFAYNRIKENLNIEDYNEYKNLIKLLNQYIKVNGHFTLLEVDSKEAYVKITI